MPILMGNGRKEDEPRRRLAVILLPESVLEELIQIFFEFVQPFRTGKRLVVAEKSKNHIRFGARQPFVRAAEALGPQADGQLIAVESKIAENEMMFGESALDHGLEPTVMLHAICKSIADQANMVARMYIQNAC